MKPVEEPARLTAFGAPPTKVIATVVYRDPGERAGRALGGLALFWGLAVLGVFIPVAHFILVPTLLCAGVIVGVRRAREDRTLVQVRGVCPRCGAEHDFKVGGRVARERTLACPDCHNNLLLMMDGRPEERPQAG